MCHKSTIVMEPRFTPRNHAPGHIESHNLNKDLDCCHIWRKFLQLFLRADSTALIDINLSDVRFHSHPEKFLTGLDENLNEY